MHVIKTLCCAAAIALFAIPSAHADEWNKKTYLTFSGPVQIPGATLPAGTYLFQLADPDNARHVVMVASKDGSHIYGMFLTIPNDRIDTPDDNVVMFGETPAGAPQAVQAWWYPGERIGEEFVYPRTQATAIAKANHKEVLATDAEANANGSQSDRMAALRGSKVGRVDETGNMKSESTNAQNNTATAPATAAATTGDRTQASGNMTYNTPTNSSASAKRGVNDGYQAKANTSAAATTTAPANTVDGRNAKSAKTTTAHAKTAVGTSGQTNTANNSATNTAHRSRKQLPRTASSLELFELLSGLTLAAGFSIRRLRASESR